MNGGWIKVNRNIKSHWLWADERRLKWWLDILLSVNYEQKKVIIRNKSFVCERGQCVKSLDSWAYEWRVTKKTVKAFFDLLQSEGMLETESITVTTRITVCNYEDYQDSVNDNDTDNDNDKDTANDTGTETESKREVNANYPQHKKVKNIKKERNKKIKEEEEQASHPPSPSFLPPTLEDVIAYFREKGYREDIAVKAHEYYAVSNWRDSKGNQVKNWKQKMINVWFKPENAAAPAESNNHGLDNSRFSQMPFTSKAKEIFTDLIVYENDQSRTMTAQEQKAYHSGQITLDYFDAKMN